MWRWWTHLEFNAGRLEEVPGLDAMCATGNDNLPVESLVSMTISCKNIGRRAVAFGEFELCSTKEQESILGVLQLAAAQLQDSFDRNRYHCNYEHKTRLEKECRRSASNLLDSVVAHLFFIRSHQVFLSFAVPNRPRAGRVIIASKWICSISPLVVATSSHLRTRLNLNTITDPIDSWQ
jgi:hypothetical protein